MYSGSTGQMPTALPMLDSGLFTTMVSVFLDELNLGRIDMDAVAQDRLRAEDAVVLQALHGAAAIVLQAVVDIVHALGNVDVDSRCGRCSLRPYGRTSCRRW